MTRETRAMGDGPTHDRRAPAARSGASPAQEAGAPEASDGPTPSRGTSLSDMYLRDGARLPGWASCLGAMSEGASWAIRRLGSAMAPDGYRVHLMRVQSQMLLEGAAHQKFAEVLRLFFAVSSTDEARAHCLNTLDQVALSRLLDGLHLPSRPSEPERARANEVTAKLLHSMFPGAARLEAHRRKLKGLILRMHGDRRSPLNRDFGCAFRNDGRDLLWRLIVFLHQRCKDDAVAHHLEPRVRPGEPPRPPPPAAHGPETEHRAVARLVHTDAWFHGG